MMCDGQGRPAWEEVQWDRKPNPELCQSGTHTWMARFYVSGRIAYWVCTECGKMDRVPTRLPEYLDDISGWVEKPPRLIARRPTPPAPGGCPKWSTPEGTTLCEGEPSSIYHVGLEIPELAEAHSYTLYDSDGKVVKTYEPFRERLGLHSDHYWLTRYQVIGSELIQFESHCFEESTYDVPSAGTPEQKVVLSKLKLISG